jgi:hypothetical protein
MLMVGNILSVPTISILKDTRPFNQYGKYKHRHISMAEISEIPEDKFPDSVKLPTFTICIVPLMTSPLCTPLKRNFTMASLALIHWMKISNLLISLRYTINGQCAQEDSLLEICFCGSFASLFSTIQLPDLENGTPICFLPHVALMASACFCVLSKAYKRVFVARPKLPKFNLAMLIQQMAVLGRVFTPQMKLKQC